MPKRQESLLKFFKLPGQSVPKQAKVVWGDRQYRDAGGHGSSIASDAPAVIGNYDPHGQGPEVHSVRGFFPRLTLFIQQQYLVLPHSVCEVMDKQM